MKLKLRIQDEILIYETEKDLINIGRSDDNDFIVPHEDFSRKHGQITINNEYIFLKDLGSKNGIIVDGKRLKAHNQHPVYLNSKILMANFYELVIMPPSTKNENTEDKLTEKSKETGE